MLPVALTGADGECLYQVAAGQGADAGEDVGLVETQFVAGHGLIVEDGQLAPRVDLTGVRVVGDGGTDEAGPVFPYGILGGGATDLVFDQQLLNQGRERLGGASKLARRHVVRDPAQCGDKLARGVIEGVLGGRFVHGGRSLISK